MRLRTTTCTHLGVQHSCIHSRDKMYIHYFTLVFSYEEYGWIPGALGDEGHHVSATTFSAEAATDNDMEPNTRFDIKKLQDSPLDHWSQMCAPLPGNTSPASPLYCQ